MLQAAAWCESNPGKWPGEGLSLGPTLAFINRFVVSRSMMELNVDLISFEDCTVDILFVLQEILEAHDGASKGKYTIGLGQDCMGFCTEVEDVISMRY